MDKLHRPLALAAIIGVAVIAAGAARAADRDDTVYLRTDLVSNVQNLVQPTDPDLQNAWGVAIAAAPADAANLTRTAARESGTRYIRRLRSGRAAN